MGSPHNLVLRMAPCEQLLPPATYLWYVPWYRAVRMTTMKTKVSNDLIFITPERFATKVAKESLEKAQPILTMSPGPTA